LTNSLNGADTVVNAMALPTLVRVACNTDETGRVPRLPDKDRQRLPGSIVNDEGKQMCRFGHFDCDRSQGERAPLGTMPGGQESYRQAFVDSWQCKISLLFRNGSPSIVDQGRK